MNRKDLIGKKALICFKEAGKYEQVHGIITAFDEVSLSVRTLENHLIILTQMVEKIKIREGELNELGEITKSKAMEPFWDNL